MFQLVHTVSVTGQNILACLLPMVEESNDNFLREIDELLQGESENETEQKEANHIAVEPKAHLNLGEVDTDVKSSTTPPVEDVPPQSKSGYT